MANTDVVEWRLLSSDFETEVAILPASDGNLYIELNEVGSGSLSIPLACEAASIITEGMFVVCYYRGTRRGGFFVDNIKKVNADTQEGGGQRLSISGRGALAIFDDAIIWDDGTGASKRSFTGTKASVLIDLIDENIARGVITNVAYDFTDTDDTDSNAWTDNEPIDLIVGESLLDVIRQFSKLGIDFNIVLESDGTFTLEAYNGEIGSNLSSTIFFRVGSNVEEVGEDKVSTKLKNDYLIKYRDGFARVSDSTSISTNRRRAGIINIENAQSAETAVTYGSAELDINKDPQRSIPIGVYDGVAPYIFLDYNLGDYVSLDRFGDVDSERIVGLRLFFDLQGYAHVTVILNSIIFNNNVRLTRELERLKNLWNTARDANLMEVRYWANIGDPNITYGVNDLLMVGSKLYVASGYYLFIYDTINGGWTRVTLEYSSRCLTSVGTDIYIGCFHAVLKYEISTDTVTNIGSVVYSDPLTESVSCITSIGTDVYCGGVYDTIDGVPIVGVAKYDTLTDEWSELGGGGAATRITDDGTNIYAVVGGAIKVYDGSWSSLGTSPVDVSTILCIAVYGTGLLIGTSGDDHIYVWDGVSWEIFQGGLSGAVWAIAVNLTDVYVGGVFTDEGNNIVKNSGGIWFKLGEGTNNRVSNIVLYNNVVYVGGIFTQAGGKDAEKIAAFFITFEALADYLENSSSSFNLAEAIHSATAKTSMTGNDEFGMWDSISQRLRKITWSNILLSIKTYTDGLYVALTGNQTVGGVKTFSDFPVTPSSAPTLDYEVANKKYVDDNSGSLPTLDPARIVYTDPTTGDLKTSDELIFNETDDSLVIGNPTGTGDADGSYLHGIGGDKTHSGVLSTFHNLVTYAGDTARASLVKLITSLGTKASPLAVTVGTLLGRLRFAGYDGDTRVVDSATSADVKAVATEDFDSSGHGTKVVVSTTPNNSTTMQDVLEIGEDGQITLNEYGSGMHTGTATKFLAVDEDGNVIEEDAPILLPFGVYSSINPLTTHNSLPYAATIDRTMIYVKWSVTLYVQTTNNASNYWTVYLERASDAQLIASVNTSADVNDTYNLKTVTSFSVSSHGVTDKAIRIRAAKTNNPGAIYILGVTLEVR